MFAKSKNYGNLQKTETLNDFFTSVFTKENSSQISHVRIFLTYLLQKNLVSKFLIINYSILLYTSAFDKGTTVPMYVAILVNFYQVKSILRWVFEDAIFGSVPSIKYYHT